MKEPLQYPRSIRVRVTATLERAAARRAKEQGTTVSGYIRLLINWDLENQRYVKRQRAVIEATMKRWGAAELERERARKARHFVRLEPRP